MFPLLLETQGHQLAAIAKDWLDSGATEFSIWWGETLLAGWPKGVKRGGAFISVPIQVDETHLGELRVKGVVDGFATRARLQAEAGLISVSIVLASLKAELETARRVQLSMLPQNVPQVEGLDIWVASKSASLVTGDFYDFFMTSWNAFAFTVGDISGKGMPAALLMSMIHTVLQDSSRSIEGTTPKSILSEANAKLHEDFMRAGMFATVFYGQYDQDQRQLFYANAGHSPVIYYKASGKAQLLEADGAPLGVLPESLCYDQQLRLSHGDVIIVATDGLADACNQQGDRIGYDRLLEWTVMFGNRSSQAIVNGLFSAVDEFCAGAPQIDDQTIVVLRCTSR